MSDSLDFNECYKITGNKEHFKIYIGYFEILLDCKSVCFVNLTYTVMQNIFHNVFSFIFLRKQL